MDATVGKWTEFAQNIVLRRYITDQLKAERNCKGNF